MVSKTTPRTSAHGWGSIPRRAGRGLLVVAALAGIAVASIAFSLRVTPAQTVSALGQTVAVGTTSPSLSLSGPGKLDLFGQSLDTKVRFHGPVRPRLVLTNITINRQIESLLQPAPKHPAVAALGDQLAGGWKRYFAWEIVFVAVGATILLGLVARWRHAPWRRTVTGLLGGLVLVEGMNVGVILMTASSAPAILRQVHSMDQLVGRAEPIPFRAVSGPALPDVQAVVLGDSTAAGVGNRPVENPTSTDTLCRRSADAYAVDLARANGWHAVNLSCGGATIRDGLLGAQTIAGQRVPAQVDVARRAVEASFVIVSVGANDLQWSNTIRLCAVGACDDRASEAFFQRSLARFTQDDYGLLRQLQDLPGHPTVIINSYYVPFGADTNCLSAVGLTPSKIALLRSRLDALNSVLASGAKTFGFASIQPDFEGHELCTQQPYVQGLTDPAPFHPNVEGALAIALADERIIAGR
jgi:lysophospholipase L1-like esterase